MYSNPSPIISILRGLPLHHYRAHRLHGHVRQSRMRCSTFVILSILS